MMTLAVWGELVREFDLEQFKKALLRACTKSPFVPRPSDIRAEMAPPTREDVEARRLKIAEVARAKEAEKEKTKTQ